MAIKKHSTIPKQNRQSGYGFVYYYDISSATRALTALKHVTIRDLTLNCSISHKSEQVVRHSVQPGSLSPSQPYASAASHSGGLSITPPASRAYPHHSQLEHPADPRLTASQHHFGGRAQHGLSKYPQHLQQQAAISANSYSSSMSSPSHHHYGGHFSPGSHYQHSGKQYSASLGNASKRYIRSQQLMYSDNSLGLGLPEEQGYRFNSSSPGYDRRFINGYTGATLPSGGQLPIPGPRIGPFSTGNAPSHLYAQRGNYPGSESHHSHDSLDNPDLNSFLQRQQQEQELLQLSNRFADTSLIAQGLDQGLGAIPNLIDEGSSTLGGRSTEPGLSQIIDQANQSFFPHSLLSSASLGGQGSVGNNTTTSTPSPTAAAAFNGGTNIHMNLNHSALSALPYSTTSTSVTSSTTNTAGESSDPTSSEPTLSSISISNNNPSVSSTNDNI